jgi:hypothetical protein
MTSTLSEASPLSASASICGIAVGVMFAATRARAKTPIIAKEETP